MIHLVKITLFLLVNLGGYNVVRLLAWVTHTLGIFPRLPAGPDREMFNYLLFQGGFFVWVACGLASIGYFVVPYRELRTWLILSPLYGPFLYSVALMIYFNFKDLTLL